MTDEEKAVASMSKGQLAREAAVVAYARQVWEMDNPGVAKLHHVVRAVRLFGCVPVCFSVPYERPNTTKPTTKPGWLERLLYQPVRLLRWLRLADYDEAREQATRDIVQRISRND